MKLPRKMTVALLAGVSIAGIAGASAASLGGVSAGSLGSGSTTVASCDTQGGVTVSYTTAFQGGAYVVTDVTVGSVDVACNGQTGSVTLLDVGGNDIGSGSIGVTGSGSFKVHLNKAADAASVVNAAVLIAG